MAWTGIKKVLGSTIRLHKIAGSLEAVRIVEAANRFFGARFDDSTQRLVRAVSFSQGILTVACRSPVYAEEVKLSLSELQTELKKINPPVELARLKFVFADDMLNDEQSVL